MVMPSILGKKSKSFTLKTLPNFGLGGFFLLKDNIVSTPKEGDIIAHQLGSLSLQFLINYLIHLFVVMNSQFY